LYTTLGGPEVFARSRGAGTSTASLLDVQGAALNDLTTQALHGSVGHLDEAEATGLAGVGVPHDLAFLNLAILLEEALDLGLLDARVDAGDEKVRARVHALVVLVAIVVLGGSAAGRVLADGLKTRKHDWESLLGTRDIPVVAVGRQRATARIMTIVATRRGTTIAIVARSVV
jgi:hypothetical protein